MKNNKYDTILVVDNIELLTEAKKDREAHSSYGTSGFGAQGGIHSYDGYADYIDPSLYASASFGNSLKNQLSNMGGGYFATVSDFGKWVVVNAGYHNHATGRTAEKTFLIVFKHKGDGHIFSTSNKWRTVSGASQAASYIKSAINSISNSTNSVL